MERGFGDVVFTANGLDGVIAIGLAQDSDNFLGNCAISASWDCSLCA